jgi:hypothetical protein
LLDHAALGTFNGLARHWIIDLNRAQLKLHGRKLLWARGPWTGRRLSRLLFAYALQKAAQTADALARSLARGRLLTPDELR